MPRRHRHPGLNSLRLSIPRLYAPLSTLRRYPRGYLRMTRGRSGSLVLHRNGLSPSTSCRPSRRTRGDGWPMRSPVNASPASSRIPAHDFGVDVVRYSSIVVDSHHLLLAGLPAHSSRDQNTRHNKGSPRSPPTSRPSVIGGGEYEGWSRRRVRQRWPHACCSTNLVTGVMHRGHWSAAATHQVPQCPPG